MTEAEKKVLTHKSICDEMHALYKAKNADYGDSFAKLRERYPAFVCMRIFDKLNRAETLMQPNHERKVENETIEDTLMDIANYCIMEILERRLKNENK